jgi:hypothetical protein
VSAPGIARFALLSTALWIAASGYRGERPLRFLSGLALGATLSHLGWGALHWSYLRSQPLVLLDPLAGHWVLLVPLGPLLLAREAASWRALPAALAAARAGCLPVGCCYARIGAWGVPLGALLEMAAMLALHAALGRATDRRAPPLFLLGFGLTRLALEPWRAAPPLDSGGAALALAWAAAGAWGLVRETGIRPPQRAAGVESGGSS